MDDHEAHELRNRMSAVATQIELARAHAARLAAIADEAGAEVAAALERDLTAAFEGVMRLAELTRAFERPKR